MSEKEKSKKHVSKRSKKKLHPVHYGSILFAVGILIAIIAAFLSLEQRGISIVLGILGIIGIAVGILNIKRDETISFLVASLVLVTILSPFLGLLTQYFIKSQALGLFFTYLIGIIGPAAIVVALKTIFMAAKD